MIPNISNEIMSLNMAAAIILLAIKVFSLLRSSNILTLTGKAVIEIHSPRNSIMMGVNPYK
jgi:hypothetical protein